MKRFLIIFFVIAFSAAFSQARSGSAIGIIIGTPTGLSLKLADNGRTQINTAAGWSFGKDNRFYLHVDYIFYKFRVIRTGGGTAPFKPYMGLGGHIRTGSDNIGARLPLGIGYDFRDVPLEMFVELAPVLNLAPETDVDIAAAVALRFTF